MQKLIVSPAPHIGNIATTRKIMLMVVIALIPSVIASIIVFGLFSLLTILLSIGSAVLAEYLYRLLTHTKQTINDCSAVVTGLILALNLPPVLPLYIPIVGSFFAIIIVKMLFGGLGRNFANPAATARVFLLLAWAPAMSSYVAPVDYKNGFFKAIFSYFNTIGRGIDGITSATPLSSIKDSIESGSLNNINIWDLFVGNIAGSLGEISVIALLIGGIFLIVTKVIDFKIPLAVLGSVAVFTLIFYKDGINMILPMLFSGGLMLGAFFMATDYASSPNTNIAIIIYAVGIGFFTVLIRRFGAFPEGVSMAILLMNLTVPLLDKYLMPKPYGYKKTKKKEKEATK